MKYSWSGGVGKWLAPLTVLAVVMAGLVGVGAHEAKADPAWNVDANGFVGERYGDPDSNDQVRLKIKVSTGTLLMGESASVKVQIRKAYSGTGYTTLGNYAVMGGLVDHYFEAPTDFNLASYYVFSDGTGADFAYSANGYEVYYTLLKNGGFFGPQTMDTASEIFQPQGWTTIVTGVTDAVHSNDGSGEKDEAKIYYSVTNPTGQSTSTVKLYVKNYLPSDSSYRLLETINGVTSGDHTSSLHELGGPGYTGHPHSTSGYKVKAEVFPASGSRSTEVQYHYEKVLDHLDITAGYLITSSTLASGTHTADPATDSGTLRVRVSTPGTADHPFLKFFLKDDEGNYDTYESYYIDSTNGNLVYYLSSLYQFGGASYADHPHKDTIYYYRVELWDRGALQDKVDNFVSHSEFTP